jgi:hypothetical protein
LMQNLDLCLKEECPKLVGCDYLFGGLSYFFAMQLTS